MSQKFNYNELIIISKYIESDDYKNYFKTFPNINTYYYSTFNYITINENFINFQIIKKYNNLLKTFPNINTIIININTSKIKTGDNASINILYSIIKLFNIFSNLYPNKFIKINVCDKYLFIIFNVIAIQCFNKIDKLIKNGNLNEDFKIYIENYHRKYCEELKNFKFIMYVKFKNYEQINFSKLKHNQIYDIRNKYIYKTKEFINGNNVNNVYVHAYKNTIFKNLNGDTCFILGNKILYSYLLSVKYFPSYYKLMNLGIKLSINKTELDYVIEYRNKLNLNCDISYIYDYLFVCPFKKDMIKIITTIKSYIIYDYYNVVNILKDIFENDI